MVRKPIAAGLFYPDTKEKLTALLKKLTPLKSSKSSLSGLIAPHAGYSFSGKVAAAAIARITPVKNIIMLGPNHSGLGKKFSLSAAQSWQTPYGKVEVNQEISQRILSSGPLIKSDSLAHQNEHSLEVLIPILQYFLKNFTIVPICCSLADKKTYKEAAAQIKKGLKNDFTSTLIIASTDLSHYQPEEVARQKDRQAIQAIIELDPEKFLDKIQKENITVCGAAPVAVALLCLENRVKKGEVVLYQTSAETSRDYDSVVGYVGILLK